MQRIISKYYPVVFIIILWVIFSSPFLFFGKVPYSSTYQVNHFAPWSSYEKYWGPVKNGAMPDVTDQIYPWRYFAIQSLKIGEMPLWNPYNFSGNPHLANFQSAVLSPFNILFFILPFIDAWSVNVLLAPLLAGFFTYLFAKSLKTSQAGALVSSISFMFCGFIAVWMAYGTLSLAIAFLPLALLSIEKWFETKKVWPLIVLSLSIPLSLFSGHFQTSLYFLIFVFAYLIFKAIGFKNKKHMLYIFLSFIFGVLISFPQLLPSIEFYSESVRSQIFNNGGGIPWWHLVTFFSPDFFGNPVTRNDWMGNYAEWANFAGTIPFTLFFFSIFSIKKNPTIKFFLFAGLLSIILAIDSPLQILIGNLRIPVLSTSNPTRIIVLASFALSILCAFGVDNLLDFLQKQKIKSILKGFTPVIVIFLVVWISIIIFHFPAESEYPIAKRNMLLPSILFGALFFGSIFYSVVNKNTRFFKIFILVIIILTAYDSLRFAQKWMPFDPRDLVFPDTPVLKSIKNNIGFGRIYGNLGTQVETYYGYSSIQGYDPLYIGRYGEFIRFGVKNSFLEGERSVVRFEKFEKHAQRVLDLLGVSLIFHPVGDTNQSWAFPVWRDERYQKIYKDEKFELYKNNSAFSRAVLFQQFEVIKNSRGILSKFYSNNFDFRKKIILEEDPNVVPDKNTKGSINITSYSPNEILIQVKTEGPTLLFLSDNYYPGWKAFVDGLETKILRANYTFRAIEVSAGEHDVIFKYDPLSFKLGIVSAIIGVAGLIFIGLKSGKI